MQAQQKKRKYVLLSLVLMLASLACLCTSGISDLIDSNVPDEVIIPEEVLPLPEISEPLEAPPESDPGESTSSTNGNIQIVDTNYYEDEFGSFNFLILVENTGSAGLEFVESSVTLKDANGNIVANESAYSSVNLIQPGTRAPISVYWSDGVPEWETFEIFVEGEEESGFFDYYTGIEVISSELVQDEFGGFEVIGEVQNTGDLPADFVSVAATFYNASGRIIGEGYASVDADVMQPGDSATFSLFIFSTAEDIATYDLVAEGSEVSE